MKNRIGTHWDKNDTTFVIIIIAGFILYEIFFGESAVGAEYKFTPPPPPQVIIEVEAKVNGIPITLGVGECTAVMDTSQEPVNFTACPKGYLCKPNAAKGMRTLRVDEAARWKRELKEWSDLQNRTGERH